MTERHDILARWSTSYLRREDLDDLLAVAAKRRFTAAWASGKQSFASLDEVLAKRGHQPGELQLRLIDAEGHDRALLELEDGRWRVFGYSPADAPMHHEILTTLWNRERAPKRTYVGALFGLAIPLIGAGSVIGYRNSSAAGTPTFMLGVALALLAMWLDSRTGLRHAVNLKPQHASGFFAEHRTGILQIVTAVVTAVVTVLATKLLS